jgi:hypothetical protein
MHNLCEWMKNCMMCRHLLYVIFSFIFFKEREQNFVYFYVSLFALLMCTFFITYNNNNNTNEGERKVVKNFSVFPLAFCTQLESVCVVKRKVNFSLRNLLLFSFNEWNVPWRFFRFSISSYSFSGMCKHSQFSLMLIVFLYLHISYGLYVIKERRGIIRKTKWIHNVSLIEGCIVCMDTVSMRCERKEGKERFASAVVKKCIMWVTKVNLFGDCTFGENLLLFHKTWRWEYKYILRDSEMMKWLAYNNNIQYVYEEENLLVCVFVFFRI